ncbi:hypothetical protein L9F63_023033, partial [Diploptera punctata]
LFVIIICVFSGSSVFSSTSFVFCFLGSLGKVQAVLGTWWCVSLYLGSVLFSIVFRIPATAVYDLLKSSCQYLLMTLTKSSLGNSVRAEVIGFFLVFCRTRKDQLNRNTYTSRGSLELYATFFVCGHPSIVILPEG